MPGTEGPEFTGREEREAGMARPQPAQGAPASGEDVLRQALAVCEQVVEGLPSPLVIVDRQYTYRVANTAYLRLRGVTRDQIIAQPVAEIIGHEAFEELFRPQVDRSVGGEITAFEAWVDYPGIGHRYVELHIYPLYIEGRVELVAALIRDLTAQKQAEASLERREGEFRRVLDSLPDIITRFDRNLRYTFVSPNVERISGSPPSAYIGKTPRETELFDGAALELSDIYSRRAFETGEVQTFEHSVTVPRGTFYYFVRVIPEFDAQGQVVSLLNISQDVTERKRAEIEREQSLDRERRARAEAEAALRLRDQFLSVAAHELKTPLTSLRGQAELTMRRIEQEGVADPARVHHAMQVIDRQVDRLNSLVAQLFDISRIESGELRPERQPTNLVPLARGVVEAMQAGASRHSLTLHAPASLVAWVDPARIEQVLYNLVDNAIRYSPRGGPVEVDLSAPAAGTVRIAVRDYGIGVPPEQRAQLFTRFFQAAQRPAGGLGLGLYISQRIVELHGGRIWAEFPEDGGSRFVVELPRGEEF